MLKVLFTSALLSLLSSSSESNVFICDSENAVAYHYKKDCRGIKPCQEDILQVTTKEAQGRKLRLCKWED